MKSNLRKGISVLLCLAMVFAMMPNFSVIRANAENESENMVAAETENKAASPEENEKTEGSDVDLEDEPVGNDQPEVSGAGETNTTGTWADKDEDGKYKYADFSPFLDEEGNWLEPSDKTYTISNNEQLAGLMVIVNADTNTTIIDKYNKGVTIGDTQVSFRGYTIKLTADIDLREHEWVPIGKDNAHVFSASLDGSKADGGVCKIQSMKIGSESSPKGYTYAGLIGYYFCADNTAVSNIGIGASTAIYNYGITGGLVGYAMIQNPQGSNIELMLENCYNTGEISGEYSGGLVGYTMTNNFQFSNIELMLENCYNTGEISGEHSGGLVGYAEVLMPVNNDKIMLKNCYNTGNLSGNNSSGGLIGFISDVYGNLSASVTLTNCYNSGRISGNSNTGGLIGFIKDVPVTLDNCYYLGAAQGVSGKTDEESGAINLLKDAQTESVGLSPNDKETIKNTEANTKLRADKDSPKLGAGFIMEYVYSTPENVTIGPLNGANLLPIFVPNGAKSGPVTLTGIKVTQNGLTENGYTGAASPFEVKVTEEKKFQLRVYYTLTLDPNGGSWDEEPQGTRTMVYEQGATVTLPGSRSIEKEGYTFVCWNTESDGTGADVSEIDSSFAANMQLYAKWTANDQVITNRKPAADKETNNGYIEIPTKAATDAEVTLTVVPQKGYSLQEESLTVTGVEAKDIKKISEEGNVKTYTFKMPAEGVTVDAEFTANTNKITNNKPKGEEVNNKGYIKIQEEATTDATVTFTVESEAGYSLKEGSLIVTGVENIEKISEEGNVKTYKFKMPASAVTVDGEFTANTNKITNNKPKGEEVNNKGYIKIQEEATTDATVTFTVESEAGYSLKEGSLIVTGVENIEKISEEGNVKTYKFKMPASAVTVDGEFTANTNKITNNKPKGEEVNNKGYIKIQEEATTDATVTFTVESEAGYSLKEGSLIVTGVENIEKISEEGNVKTYKFKMPASAVTVDGEFTANTNKITNNKPKDKKDDNKGYIEIQEEAKTDAEVTFTVESEASYSLKEGSLTVTGVEAEDIRKISEEGNVKTYTFKMPAEDVTVDGEFTANTYNITIDEIKNGSVTADPEAAVEGAKVTLTVVPNAGYSCSGVKITYKGLVDEEQQITPEVSGNKYTFEMPAGNVTVTVKFEKYLNDHKIKSDASNKNVTVNFDKRYAKLGETVEVTVTPDKGYEVDRVYVNEEEKKLNSDYKFTFTMPDKDAVIKVTMKNGWVRDSKKCEVTGTPWWYYYKDGKKLTGWQEIEIQVEGRAEQVQRYYFDPDREDSAHTGWMKDENSNWYYFAVNHYRNNTLLETPEQGLAMMWTGWANDGGPKWYYLDAVKQDFASGRGIMKTGWIQDGGKEWYYFKSDDTQNSIYGSIVIGWGYIDGKWYYFTDDESENMRYYGQMQRGWQLIDGYWYYFYDDGAMASNTWIGDYFVDENGRWIS